MDKNKNIFFLQVYMGFLSHKCIRTFPTDGSWGVLNHDNWFVFTNNRSNWFKHEDAKEQQLFVVSGFGFGFRLNETVQGQKSVLNTFYMRVKKLLKNVNTFFVNM